jgi:hypothetical protein
MTPPTDERDCLIDLVFDALADAGMEVVYADTVDDGQQTRYSAAGIDAREPMLEGIAAVIAAVQS